MLGSDNCPSFSKGLKEPEQGEFVLLLLLRSVPLIRSSIFGAHVGRYNIGTAVVVLSNCYTLRSFCGACLVCLLHPAQDSAGLTKSASIIHSTEP